MPPESGGRDAALILDMAFAARDAMGFVEGLDEAALLASRLHQNAVIHSLAVVGEAAGTVSADFRAGHPEISWREITGMRHRLIHGYAEVRLDVVWAVVKHRLPELLKALEPVLPPEPYGGPA